ncbi:MAG: DUF1707 domain-containing protein [Gemmatimonadaceae bacterium]
MNTPAPLGPSTPQREQVIERLSRSFAEDAITMDEFERRAELVYSALTVADLQSLVADLPAVIEPVEPTGKGKGKSVSRIVTGDRITTLLGSTERRMPTTIPRQMSVRTVFGNTELDFRGVQFEAGITEVHVRCLFGNVEITVPEGVRVELLCSSVLANVGTTGGPSYGGEVPTEAVLRVTGRAMFANVEVHRGILPDDSSLT